MNIFLLNAQGMRPECETTKYKIPLVAEEVNSSAKFIPFFAISETHFQNEHLDAEVSVKNYEIYRADRKSRKQGGVALYIHNSLTVNDVDRYSDSTCEAVMVPVNS